MTENVLPATTDMGAVTLTVGNLDAMVDYYHRGIGLTVLDQTGPVATLGRSGRPLLHLHQDGSLKHASATAAGLFHTAFLFETKADLAAAVYSVAKHFPNTFTGSSDHFVSNAMYFDDPERNGVELYWDLPRDEWRWQGDRVMMGTEYLDPNFFLKQNLTEDGANGVADTPAVIGHVHLKVGDLQTGRDFYVNTLGFEVTAEYGSQALFVAAGGYHHHLGMNTWQSRGAGERTPALGLGEVSIQIGDENALGALRERLAHHKIAVADTGAALEFQDPWKNRVRVQA
jgi:catechol 2,3-dioxygenase